MDGGGMEAEGTGARIALRGVRVLAVVLALSIGAASAAEVPSPEARAQLAPTGKLRAAFVVSEPALAAKDPASGELQGLGPDLARALAEGLGVPLQPVVYNTPEFYAESLGSGAWDIGLAARDPSRTNYLDFSASVVLVDNVFLAAPGKTFKDAADLDRPKVLIAVPRNSLSDRFLARTLKHARLIRVEAGPRSAVEALRSHAADAYGDDAQFLSGVAAQVPGSQLVEGTFTVVEMAIGVSRGRPAALAYVNAFVREAKTSGFLQQAIEREGLHGVHVAPP